MGCAKATISDGVVSPKDRDWVEVVLPVRLGRPPLLFASEDNGLWEAKDDVCGQRGEVESEHGKLGAQAIRSRLICESNLEFLSLDGQR